MADAKAGPPPEEPDLKCSLSMSGKSFSSSVDFAPLNTAIGLTMITEGSVAMVKRRVLLEALVS